MTRSHPLHLVAILLGVSAGKSPLSAELPVCESQTPCRVGSNTTTYCGSSQFWFEAESASGASGDVVGVTISLHYAPELGFELTSIDLVACHDPLLAELVGEPVYSDEILFRDPIWIVFGAVHEDQDRRDKGFGFYSHFGPLVDTSPVDGELPLMTVYYRLMGFPGESTEISFCDGQVLKWGPSTCNFSGIYDVRIIPSPWIPPLLSTQNQNGTLTILPGPATRPDRPPEPPEAVVYPELPTSAEVNLRVRIENAPAVPGERGVPVEVFVTADVEYTGVIVPIDFDERYVRVARVEDRFLAGTAIIDNEDTLPGAQPDEGYAVIASSLVGKRRIAAVGEEFHAATLYVDVLESAAAVSRTLFEVRSVGGRVRDPFVVVRYASGDAAEKVEVGPAEVENGVLAIRAALETLAGDATFDGELNISDPISILGFLFLGKSEPVCPPAADYDRDGQLDISDPIRLLNVLFSGQAPPAGGDDDLVRCR